MEIMTNDVSNKFILFVTLCMLFECIFGTAKIYYHHKNMKDLSLHLIITLVSWQ